MIVFSWLVIRSRIPAVKARELASIELGGKQRVAARFTIRYEKLDLSKCTLFYRFASANNFIKCPRL
jgi:hypothetical protein